jgi:hypothetical protein
MTFKTACNIFLWTITNSFGFRQGATGHNMNYWSGWLCHCGTSWPVGVHTNVTPRKTRPSLLRHMNVLSSNCDGKQMALTAHSARQVTLLSVRHVCPEIANEPVMAPRVSLSLPTAWRQGTKLSLFVEDPDVTQLPRSCITPVGYVPLSYHNKEVCKKVDRTKRLARALE